MCSTISIPISPKIPKIILRKFHDQFGDFGLGHSAKNWEMWQLLRLIQWRLHIAMFFFSQQKVLPYFYYFTYFTILSHWLHSQIPSAQ